MTSNDHLNTLKLWVERTFNLRNIKIEIVKNLDAAHYNYCIIFEDGQELSFEYNKWNDIHIRQSPITNNAQYVNERNFSKLKEVIEKELMDFKLRKLLESE